MSPFPPAPAILRPHGDRDRPQNPAADDGYGALRALQFLAAGRRVAAHRAHERAAAVHHPFPQAALASRDAELGVHSRAHAWAARWPWPRSSIRRRWSTTSRARTFRPQKTRALHHYRIYLGEGRLPRSVRAVGVLERDGKMSRAFASFTQRRAAAIQRRRLAAAAQTNPSILAAQMKSFSCSPPMACVW